MSHHSNHKLSLLAAAVLGACFSSGHAASILVDSALDDGTDCTLRDAITSVNDGAFATGCSSSNADALGTNDTITFDAALNNATIALTSGELFIEDPVSIDASSLSSLVIAATAGSRVVQIALGETENVSIANLTLNGGSLNFSGGGILFNGQGNLMLSDMTIAGNTATFGAGIYSSSTGSLAVSNSVISGNHSSGAGGAGINVVNAASVTIEDSVISNNTATFDGGGITSSVPSLSITNTTIANNTAGRSGGGMNLSGGLLLTGSTFHNNSTGGVGGAIGSLNNAQSPVLNNSTISGNQSSNGAGAVHMANSTHVTLVNSTLADNVSLSTPFTNNADLYLYNSILTEADNVVNCGNYASITATEDSIVHGATCGSTARTVLTGLLPLADNGGLTLTHALDIDSNAIDTGTSLECPETDQRGEKRDNNCDVGAYEYVADGDFFVIPLSGNRAVVLPSG